jgi:hypothetical protein
MPVEEMLTDQMDESQSSSEGPTNNKDDLEQKVTTWQD